MPLFPTWIFNPSNRASNPSDSQEPRQLVKESSLTENLLSSLFTNRRKTYFLNRPGGETEVLKILSKSWWLKWISRPSSLM